jgi:hypothetical protein
MMFRSRKLLLALAAITAALALALPVVSASAATPPPGQPSTLCVLLQQQLLFAQQTGNPTLAQLLTQVLALQC